MACLFAALLVISLVCTAALISTAVLGSELNHPVNLSDYLQLSTVVSLLAAIGGGLGAALEGHEAVREAAYGHRSDDGR